MNVTLRYSDEQMQRTFSALRARAPRAIARALNRATVTARTVWARDISSDTNLAVRVVTKELKTTQARPDALQARISIAGSKIPLIAWKPTSSKRGGVRAKLPSPGRGHYPHAFIATMKSGHRGVFQRSTLGPGSKRLPIHELHGPALPSVAAKMSAKAIAAGEESLLKNLAHEMDYALSQST